MKIILIGDGDMGNVYPPCRTVVWQRKAQQVPQSGRPNIGYSSTLPAAWYLSLLGFLRLHPSMVSSTTTLPFQKPCEPMQSCTLDHHISLPVCSPQTSHISYQSISSQYKEEGWYGSSLPVPLPVIPLR